MSTVKYRCTGAQREYFMLSGRVSTDFLEKGVPQVKKQEVYQSLGKETGGRQGTGREEGDLEHKDSKRHRCDGSALAYS